MLDYFLITVILGATSIVLALCPIGAVVLWRRLPYFGDAISHASVLGVVFGLIFSFNIAITIAFVGILFGLFLVRLRANRTQDVLTVVFACGFLSIGILLASIFLRNSNTDVFSYLFGDVLLIGRREIAIGVFMAIVVLAWTLFRWQGLILMSIDEDMAFAEKVDVKRLDAEFVILLAIVIGVSIKIVGALLASAFLIIPAASARNLSHHPVQMLLLSLVFGLVSAVLGMYLSYLTDTPTGPAIVLCSMVFFLFSMAAKNTTIGSS